MLIRFRSTTCPAFLRLLALACLLAVCAAHAATPVQVSANIAYSASDQRLDLYYPATNARRTALLFVHGGGFTSGNRRDMAGYAKLYAQGGFVTATIDYRLAPQFPAPAAVDDVNAAVDWLKSGAGGYQTHIERIVVIGYSAGGSLALMSGLTRPGSVAAIISVAGASELSILAASTPHARLREDIASYLRETTSAAASPLWQNLADAPPVFLIHGDQDTLVPIAQSVMMAERLRDAGITLLFKVVPGIGHEVLYPNPRLAEILQDISRFVVAVDSR